MDTLADDLTSVVEQLELTDITLVGHSMGDADLSAPLAMTGARTAELVKGSRLVVIPGAPHGLCETDAMRVNAEIERRIRAWVARRGQIETPLANVTTPA